MSRFTLKFPLTHRGFSGNLLSICDWRTPRGSELARYLLRCPVLAEHVFDCIGVLPLLWSVLVPSIASDDRILPEHSCQHSLPLFPSTHGALEKPELPPHSPCGRKTVGGPQENLNQRYAERVHQKCHANLWISSLVRLKVLPLPVVTYCAWLNAGPMHLRLLSTLIG